MTETALPPLELAGRLALALALAVFLGLAFEEVYKREQRASPGGVRTFPLLAVAGAMLYLIEPRQALAFIAGLLALGAWLHAFIHRESEPPKVTSLVIPASNLLAYLLGPVAVIEPPWVVVAISVSAVLLLGAREQLHGLISRVPQEELLTAGKFLVLVGVVLPLVPNTAVTGLTPLTPYDVWLALVAICAISYATYLVQRYAPAKEAHLLPAVLGGVYSSTVTTIVLAKRQREAGAPRADLSAGIIAASSIMYLRLGIVVALFNLRLAGTLAPALVGLFVLGAAVASFEWRRAQASSRDGGLSVPVINPLQISTAIVFAAIFVVISVASQWVRTTFGEKGILTLAAVVGVTDIDPFVLSISQGGIGGVSTGLMAAAILTAASANNVVKAAYALGFGGLASSRRPAAVLAALAALGIAAAVVLATAPSPPG